jgi:hypothetical protein
MHDLPEDGAWRKRVEETRLGIAKIAGEERADSFKFQIKRYHWVCVVLPTSFV